MKSEFNHTNGQYFASENVQLYYEACGNQNAPALLFLHGGFGNIEDLNPLLPCFADNYKIIGLDTRGHGASNLGRVQLTYELLQKDVENLAAFLKLDKLSIVGFSDGGIAAYRLATFSKLNIDKIVTIGAKWRMEDARLMQRICKGMTPDGCRQMFADDYKSYQQLNPVPQFDEFAQKVLDMWIDEGDTGMPDRRISSVNIPVLAIRGDNDPLFSLESAVGHLSFLNIPFAGHEAFKDQISTVEYFMKIFLEKE